MLDITNLDVSSFDTLNVTDMSDMFNLSQNLTSITYGNTFIYANNATIDRMFSLCPANKPSHESWTGKF